MDLAGRHPDLHPDRGVPGTRRSPREHPKPPGESRENPREPPKFPAVAHLEEEVKKLEGLIDEKNQRIADLKGISDRLLDPGEWYQILLQQQAQAQKALTPSHWHLHHHPAGAPGGECRNEQEHF